MAGAEHQQNFVPHSVHEKTLQTRDNHLLVQCISAVWVFADFCFVLVSWTFVLPLVGQNCVR